MKKFICIISIVIMTIVLCIYIFRMNNHSGVSVTFYNKTNLTLENLSIKFSNESTISLVPTIGPNQEISVTINQNKDFTEGSLNLSYYDVNQKEHQETIIGYMEKGQSVHASVYIVAIDSKGIIDFSIED